MMNRNEGMGSTPWTLFAAGALALLLALAAAFAMPGEAHALKATGGAKVYTLKMQTVDRVGPDEYGDTEVTARAEYKDYDLTGNGKRDVLKVVATGLEYVNALGDVSSEFDSAFFYINGKRVLTVKDGSDDIDAAKLKFQVIQLKNKKQFLLIDGDLYRYKSGKLVKALNAFEALNEKKERYCWDKDVTVKSVKGNTVTATMRICSHSLGVIKGDFKYVYKKGVFKRSSNSAAIAVQVPAKSGALKYAKKVTVKATKKMTAYKNASCKAKKFTIKKGQKVTFLKMYGKGSVFSVQVKSGGKTGWIKMAAKRNSPLLNNGWPPFTKLINV